MGLVQPGVAKTSQVGEKILKSHLPPHRYDWLKEDKKENLLLETSGVENILFEAQLC